MAGILRTDTIQNSNSENIITQTNSTTLTIGASGDTVILAAGASQSGFGRAGSVNWDTTPKTTGFTAVSGNGYFCNTTSSAFTVTLPVTPAAGDIVAIADYANTSATNNITVGRNGSKIDGSALDAKIKINGQVYTLVYVDATGGWKTVGQTFNQISTAEFITATGGTILTCGNYKTHVFTGPGTFTVSSLGNPAGSNTVDYLVVAGGGGGGGDRGGGGGAGGLRNASSFPVSVTGYPITVGAGGSAGAPPGSAGGCGASSSALGITSAGGGGGGYSVSVASKSGGSGAGGVANTPVGTAGASGNTPPVSPPQGNPGGSGASDSFTYGSGGGGGANATGGNAVTTPGGSGGVGGAGKDLTPVFGPGIPNSGVYAGGGGGGASSGPAYTPGPAGAGGVGGGGAGSNSSTPATSGTVNTGGGGGSAGIFGSPFVNGNGGAGGSGIVLIRYKYQ